MNPDRTDGTGPDSSVGVDEDARRVDIVLDLQRTDRTGFPEAVYCAGKSADQLDAIVRQAAVAAEPLLLTRLDERLHRTLSGATHAALAYHPESGTAVLGEPMPARPGEVAIVFAGTSDASVAQEAAAVLRFAGFAPHLVGDVGVAGLHRLLDRLAEIRSADVVIAVAGMEGALFSVLGGLVRSPVIAVPTSVGYGVAAGGRAALSSALASCAPGLTVVNIDNGFGAAVAAIKMLDLADRFRSTAEHAAGDE